MLKENEFLFLSKCFNETNKKNDFIICPGKQYELGRQNALYLKVPCLVGSLYEDEIKRFFYFYNFRDQFHLKIQSNIQKHKDFVDVDIKHFRFNVMTKGSCYVEIGDSLLLFNEGDCLIFRSDLTQHGLELIDNQACEMISIGLFCYKEERN